MARQEDKAFLATASRIVAHRHIRAESYMTGRLTSDQIWGEIEKNSFGVLGMVTPDGASRTVGIVYVVENRKMYIGAEPAAWKTKHIAQNPHVSLTIPIAKRVPLMPWIKIPAATITFSGVAKVLEQEEIGAGLFEKLYRHEEGREGWCAIEVSPQRDFITYGVGTSLLQMRFPEKARGRAPVGSAQSGYVPQPSEPPI